MARGMVIVTGGSRGIGAAIVRKLASTGDAVAINYAASGAAAEAIAAEIRAGGGNAQAFLADVASPDDVKALFAQAVAALGPLTGLVNCAGILGAAMATEDQPRAEIERLFAINVYGTMQCCGEAVRHLAPRYGGRGGAIVNISSVAARLGGLAGRVPYAATKGAIESFTRGFANEVAGDGIRVNAVAPGLIATDMVGMPLREMAKTTVPMRRVGEPEEIANAVAWLLSPEASYATGTILTISGGR